MTIKKEFSSTDAAPHVGYRKWDATSQNTYPDLDYSIMQELVDISNSSILYIGIAPTGFPQTNQGTDNIIGWPNWKIQKVNITSGTSVSTAIGWGSWVNRTSLVYS